MGTLRIRANLGKPWGPLIQEQSSLALGLVLPPERPYLGSALAGL